MAASRGPRAVTGLWAEFWEFIKQGNVVDLAVAVVIGAAFSRIVDSFVTDIVTPALLQPALEAANVETLSALSWNGIKYGSFLAAVLNFLIIALSIFAVIRIYEGFKRRVRQTEAEAEAEAAPDPAIEAQKNLTSAVERLTVVIERKAP